MRLIQRLQPSPYDSSGAGEKPIGNMLGMMEFQGVRVFSLSEEMASVDAFSFWRDNRPFVFLNNFKTAEHSIYDTGHELGHLVMHRHGGPQPSRSAEREANHFASAFLMPANDVRARMPHFISVDLIIKAKARWRVSAMAMAYRLHSLGLLSEWQYKSACIELGRRGYRTGEPSGVERETSAVWRKVLSQLWAEKTTKHEIAEVLNIPIDELEGLIWGLAGQQTVWKQAQLRMRRATDPYLRWIVSILTQNSSDPCVAIATFRAYPSTS